MALRYPGFRNLIGVAAALGLTQALAASPPSAGELDQAEANICMSNARLQDSVATSVQGGQQSIPIEQLAGRIENPVARARLQQQFDAQVQRAQAQMIETHRRDLARYQSEYRQLTSREFDTRQCNGPQVRVTHALREQQRREQAMDAQMSAMKRTLAAGEAARQSEIRISEACDAKKATEIPPEAAARLFPPGYVEKSRRAYSEFVSSYQRENGRPFDPARCR